MPRFTPAELDGLQDTQESAMQDTCRILTHSSSPDDFGNPTDGYTEGPALDCGVEMVRPEEEHGTGEVPVVVAHIRLPIDTDIGAYDRIRVTHRYGALLGEPLTVEVVGVVKRGPSGLVADTIKVTGG